MDYPSWEVFPAYEKSFAIRETLAHLAYLVRRGLVEEFERGGVMFFRRTGDQDLDYPTAIPQ